MLSPFHYFGIHDATNLPGVTWQKGKYDVAEPTNIYTADNIWTSKIISAAHEKIGDPTHMRVLGFCVSITHANFMARQFEQADIRARAITSKTSSTNRQQVLGDLRDRKVSVLFTVDLFNEGIDIPAIDVVLMLRPIENATIFPQQLGRGLRRTKDKDVLALPDFIGHQNKKIRFDLRYRNMLGRTRREPEVDIEQGFPYLPVGCHLDLDHVAKDIVLKNIREALPTSWKQRTQERRELVTSPPARYLQETGLELDAI